MDETAPAAPTRAQLRYAQENARQMARRVGVNLVVWGHVRSDMAALGVDELDVMHAIQGCRVSELEQLGSIERCCAMGRDTDGRMLRVLFVLCAERHAIEIVSVSIQGD